MSDKSKIVKELALKGQFDEVEARFGKKARAKAEAYRSKKDSEIKAPSKVVTDFSHDTAASPAKPPNTRDAEPSAAVSADAIVTPAKAAAAPKAGISAATRVVPTSKLRAVATKAASMPKAVPSKPALPISAFFRFCAERRPAIKKQNPDLKVTDVGKLLGAEWRALSSEETAPFEEQYREARAMYDRANKPTKAKPPVEATRAGASSKMTTPTSKTIVRSVGNIDVYDDGSCKNRNTGELEWGTGEDVEPRVVKAMDWSAFEVEEGAEVGIVLPALLAFLTIREAELKAAETALGVVCSLDLANDFSTDGILFGTVLSKTHCATRAAGAGHPVSSSAAAGGSSDHTLFVQAVWELSVQLAGPDGTAKGDPVVIPWLPASHDLVHEDAHVITRAAYDQTCMELDLRPGMQVCRQFPCAHDSSMGELFEGRVYFVGKPPTPEAAAFPDTPFHCLHIIWYEQDRKTRRWYIKPEQTDNLASPWDVTTSSEFVHPSNVAAFACSVPSLGSAEQVLAYVASTEAAVPFRHDPARDDPGYHRIIPEGSSVCLASMRKRLGKGEYAGAAGETAMWADLKRLIGNAKKRHQEAHWEWRAADMLEKELRAVRRAMVSGGGSMEEATKAIPRVRARPDKQAGRRAVGNGGRKRPKVTLSAKSMRGGVRRAAAATAMLTMATAITDKLDWEGEGEDEPADVGQSGQEAASSSDDDDADEEDE